MIANSGAGAIRSPRARRLRRAFDVGIHRLRRRAGGRCVAGALYLGVDFKHVAYTALSDANLLDKMPPALCPSGPADKVMTHEQVASALNNRAGLAA